MSGRKPQVPVKQILKTLADGERTSSRQQLFDARVLQAVGLLVPERIGGRIVDPAAIISSALKAAASRSAAASLGLPESRDVAQYWYSIEVQAASKTFERRSSAGEILLTNGELLLLDGSRSRKSRD